MNIQRKYSLPNCTLLLEGLSNPSKNSQFQEMRPELSTLINAECTLSGYTQTLAGGKDFFESLVRAVSGYAQEFLSNISNPQAHNSESELVQLEKVDSNRHRLSVHSDIPQPNSDNNDSSTKQTTKIDLNSVQLFDLVEAVDQFFADTQTLPELTLELQPVARGHSAVSGALLEQAVPATVGLTTLAAAAIAFNLIPAPEFKEPAEAQKKINSTAESVNPSAQPTPKTDSTTESIVPTPTQSPSSSPIVRDLEKLVSSSPEITNASRLKNLNGQVYEQINKAWKEKERKGLQSDLVYRIGAAGDGAIIGYKAQNQTANAEIEKTPLPQVLYNPASSGAIANEPIALFRVVFRNSGVLEVSPWLGYINNKSDNLGSNITDQTKLADLNQKLLTSFGQSSNGNTTYKEDLKYRVAVKQNGTIADYEPLNKAAFDNFRQTPIPKLFQGDNTLNEQQKESLAQFQVEFKPGGKVEVKPWQGY